MSLALRRQRLVQGDRLAILEHVAMPKADKKWRKMEDPENGEEALGRVINWIKCFFFVFLLVKYITVLYW